MLFNSYEFLLFLPASIIIYYVIGRIKNYLGIIFIVLSSLFFYAWWDIRFLPLLLASVITNYTAGRLIDRSLSSANARLADILLSVAVALNLCFISAFKYSAFFIENINTLFGTKFFIWDVILPLGISFFTFEQIAYLVDIRRNRIVDAGLLRYFLFVAFFPRLVAGPILRYNEIEPQIPDGKPALLWENVAVGLTIFMFGLTKKTLLADGIAPYASPIFALADSGDPVDFFTAWGGALAYTLQLYFDFSGYSDMAIGAARCFGIRFPLNFFSPYKATSIIDFWHRWHITLSRFLRDYLYIPLGGNRRGQSRRYANLMITMLLGGLWHGASWTFVVWGGLHGLYLACNHAWIALRRRVWWLDRLHAYKVVTALCWLVTFLAVVVGWVFFRAPSFDAALTILRGMIGLNGVAIPSGLAFVFGSHTMWLTEFGITLSNRSGAAFVETYLWVSALLGIALFMPNVQELMSKWKPTIEWPDATASPKLSHAPEPRLLWSPLPRWAVVSAAVTIAGVLSITRGSEFLYWQF